MNNKKIHKISEISLDIGALAAQAMLYEVACFPSPGLVSPVSNGAHNDMNFYTFIDSTSVIMKSLVLFSQKGLSEKTPKEIFYDIREIGIQAEKDMFSKTVGVNTHKGMIFLMGICCAAVSKALYENKEFNSVQEIIKEMCSDLTLNDFKGLENKSILSNGEKLYIKYNLKGVRGQAEEGMPLVFNYALDRYKNYSNLNKNDRLVNTLIEIMQFCEDTTIVNRHSLEVLEWVKIQSKYIISLGGVKTDLGKDKIEELAKVFIEKNISPGGSADLLGITVFLNLVEEYMQKNYTHN